MIAVCAVENCTGLLRAPLHAQDCTTQLTEAGRTYQLLLLSHLQPLGQIFLIAFLLAFLRLPSGGKNRQERRLFSKGSSAASFGKQLPPLPPAPSSMATCAAFSAAASDNLTACKPWCTLTHMAPRTKRSLERRVSEAECTIKAALIETNAVLIVLCVSETHLSRLPLGLQTACLNSYSHVPVPTVAILYTNTGRCVPRSTHPCMSLQQETVKSSTQLTR